jgi:uncharacterized LabA/DUF88 family protein
MHEHPHAGPRVAIMVDGANLAYGVVDCFGRAGRIEALRRILHRLPQAATGMLSPDARIVCRLLFLIDSPVFRSIGQEIAETAFDICYVAASALTDRERRELRSRADDGALKARAIAQVDDYDILVLVSNDGDFVSLVETLQAHGRPVVLGYLQCNTDDGGRVLVSQALQRAASQSLDLHSLSQREDPVPNPQKPSESEQNRHVLDLYQGEKLVEHQFVSTEVVEVGRHSKTRTWQPDLDLAPHDTSKFTSRRHLCLRFLEDGRCLVQIHADCRGSTWLNGDRMFPGETSFYQAGDRLVLGHEEQGLRLALSASSQERP